MLGGEARTANGDNAPTNDGPCRSSHRVGGEAIFFRRDFGTVRDLQGAAGLGRITEEDRISDGCRHPICGQAADV